MRIAIGNDHRGFSLKTRLINLLNQWEHEVVDLGTDSDVSIDYPDIAAAVAQQVSRQQVERGILICGTGIGMSITANKFSGVRAAPCCDPETAETSRQHNDLNVLCLAGNDLDIDSAEKILQAWLNTPFEAGRHARRLEKISTLEKSTSVESKPGPAAGN